MSAIFLHSIAEGKSRQLTDGLSDARYPVFDSDGKHLYFTASTDSGPSLEADIRSAVRPPTRSIYVVVLSKNDPSPFAPESDEEKVVKPGEERAKPDPPATRAEPAGEEPAKPQAPVAAARVPEVRIDWDRINQRILGMSLPARGYVGLQVAKARESPGARGAGLPRPARAPGDDRPSPRSQAAAIRRRRHRRPVLRSVCEWREDAHGAGGSLDDSNAASDGAGDAWRRFRGTGRVGPLRRAGRRSRRSGGGPGSFTLRTEDIEVRSEPRVEWKQMYHDAWRIQREFFYDPNLHGLDLTAAIKKYEPYLESVMSRRDLNYVFADMMGEITVGHLGVGGGDVPETKTIVTGLLGADYRIENGRYRFSRIYDGENWNPDLKAPLTQPGVNVQEGEYLLAVNGREVRAADNVYSFFEATAGKSVLLRVGPNPDGSGAREVTVVPVPSEARLRNLAWIEGNRRKVDDATNGRVAYVYMPDTSFGGLTNFTRYYYAQVGKEAVIIDERFNGGGALATDIIEHLKRTMMSLVATRDGEDEVQPQGAIFGPKVMIINEFAGSGGDAMPNYFRRAGVGKLDRQAHVGRPRRARWRAASHGWRLRHRPELRRVGPRRRVGCRERRHPARHRSRARSGAGAAGEGPATRARDRGGHDGVEEEPGREADTAGVPQLSPEEDHDDDESAGRVKHVIAVTEARDLEIATGAPLRVLLTSAASMNAMISTVTSIGTGGLPVRKNSTAAEMRP